MKKISITFLVSFFSTLALADNQAIISNLKRFGVSNVEVKHSPVQGLKTVLTDQGILYASEDGRYFLQGKLFELTDKGVVDLSGKALMTILESYKAEMIIYPAKKQKHVVTVFFDITCHYCHKMYQRIKEYNDLGITIRYLAFPRRGMDKTAQQMEAIFTAKDPVYALNQAENGKLPKQLKTPNIVEKHYRLGLQFGVRGTPSIVNAQGELIAGYLEPKALLAALEQ